ncbi:porin family protein [Sphingobacterium sp. Mn56C]|uniref:porin family protein n=1 Tax=Sphingobacterium sp. Mn56C TaxID=3395261 RepID=UPI003BBB9224
MKKIIYTIALMVLVSGVAMAQNATSASTSKDSVENRFGFQALIGGKIGGSSPVSMPAEIRKIRSYQPALPFFVGVKATYQIDKKWGVQTGVTFEGKGMNTKATVKGYRTSFNANENSEENVKGYYTGDITTNVHNLYITVPVQATFKLSDAWDLQAGPYVSFAVRRKFYGQATSGYMRSIVPTGTKVLITDSEYDFSSDVRKIDVGMSVGSRYMFCNRFYGLAQFDYGFNNIMRTGFESISFGLHNIFLNVGIGMKIK